MGLRNFLGLLFLASLWGPSFLFIKVAVQEIPPLTMAGCRVGLAALLLFAILKMQGQQVSNHRRGVWKHYAFAGAVGNAVPFVLFNWGELHIDSAVASILNGTTPLFTLLIAHFFTKDDRLTRNKMTGAFIGFGGLVLLVGPALLAGVKASSLGLLAVTGAALCYGIVIVYSRRYLRGLPGLVAPAAQLGYAALFLTPLSLLFERPLSLPMPSWPALGSLLALTVLGTSIAFVVYFRLLETTPASQLSMVTYLVPVFGILLGVMVLDERLAWNAYAGCAMILLGVMVVNGYISVTKIARWKGLARNEIR